MPSKSNIKAAQATTVKHMQELSNRVQSISRCETKQPISVAQSYTFNCKPPIAAKAAATGETAGDLYCLAPPCSKQSLAPQSGFSGVNGCTILLHTYSRFTSASQSLSGTTTSLMSRSARGFLLARLSWCSRLVTTHIDPHRS